jgi:hypothetical protein
MIVIFVVYAFLGVATIVVLRAMATRWRVSPLVDDETAPYGPRPEAAATAGTEVDAGAEVDAGRRTS